MITWALTLHYNQKGLLDKWTEHQPDFNYEVSFSVEYDRYRNVSQLKYYDHGNTYYGYIYDTLFKKKYKFTYEHYKSLRLKKYINVPVKSYDVMHHNITYAICGHLEYGNLDDLFDYCIELLKCLN